MPRKRGRSISRFSNTELRTGAETRWKTMGNFLLGIGIIPCRKEPFFETGGKVSASTQSNIREPGEIPGRLRHCNGYKLPVPLDESPGRRE